MNLLMKGCTLYHISTHLRCLWQRMNRHSVLQSRKLLFRVRPMTIIHQGWWWWWWWDDNEDADLGVIWDADGNEKTAEITSNKLVFVLNSNGKVIKVNGGKWKMTGMMESLFVSCEQPFNSFSISIAHSTEVV